MKISELIESLEQMKAKHGDIPVGDTDGTGQLTELEYRDEDEEYVECISLTFNGSLEQPEEDVTGDLPLKDEDEDEEG